MYFNNHWLFWGLNELKALEGNRAVCFPPKFLQFLPIWKRLKFYVLFWVLKSQLILPWESAQVAIMREGHQKSWKELKKQDVKIKHAVFVRFSSWDLCFTLRMALLSTRNVRNKRKTKPNKKAPDLSHQKKVNDSETSIKSWKLATCKSLPACACICSQIKEGMENTVKASI